MTTSEMTANNEPAEIAARFINSTQRNIFLTGKAGTGKTTFLRSIVRRTYKNTVIVAPTGIAAINAGGTTIHSLFQLPFGAFLPVTEKRAPESGGLRVNTAYSLLREQQLNRHKRRLLTELELLVIDEVSMLRADILDAMDTVLRSVRRVHHLPFGGVQVLFIGDLLQLPPVVKDEEWQLLREHYQSIFFFNAKVLREFPPVYIELDKIYRQTDDVFIALLNNLRNNQATLADIELLNTHYKPDFRPDPKDNTIRLTTHNYKADAINREALQELDGKTFTFEADVEGEFPESMYPLERSLVLKQGAQVMFVKNDPGGGQKFFNGKIGRISAISRDGIDVRFEEESRTVSVDRYEWKNTRYTYNEGTGAIEENDTGTFTQFPLRLAWAITVHKSQGLTFSKAIVDIGDAFAPGQVYVALSRLTSLDGLVLSSKLDPRRLMTDEQVSAFSKSKADAELLGTMLESEAKFFIGHYTAQSFNFTALQQEFRAHLESYTDKEHKSREKYFSWAEKLFAEFSAIKTVADKFTAQVGQLTQAGAPDYKQAVHKRVQSAKDYFMPLLKALAGEVRRHTGVVQQEKKVKQYLSDLSELEAAIFRQMREIAKAESLLQAFAGDREPERAQVYANVPKSEPEPVYVNDDEPDEELARGRIPQKKKAKKEKTPKEKKTKAPKIDTKAVTFALYSEGKTVAEICVERKMAQTTIEGHLVQYAAQGKVDALQFVSAEKKEKIVAAARELNTTFLSPIRQHLGEEFSFTEIKFALASEWSGG